MEARFKGQEFWMDFKVARVRRDLTQAQVGEEFGVGEPAVSQWENKNRMPSAIKFLTLCKAFDLNPLDYVVIEKPAAWMQQQLFDLEELDRRNAGVGTSETVWRTKAELDRFDRMDLEGDLPVGYSRERADLNDYYRLDAEMGY